MDEQLKAIPEQYGFDVGDWEIVHFVLSEAFNQLSAPSLKSLGLSDKHEYGNNVTNAALALVAGIRLIHKE